VFIVIINTLIRALHIERKKTSSKKDEQMQKDEKIQTKVIKNNFNYKNYINIKIQKGEIKKNSKWNKY
jgi:hypothetical protein